MNFFLFFMDGVGLGNNDPKTNPFVVANLPTLDSLLEGNKLVDQLRDGKAENEGNGNHHRHATLLSIDACLGIEGLPQSATGQAALLTGKNVPARLKMHEGPKPNPQIMKILQEGTIFSELVSRNRGATLLNAYPPRYFGAIERGYRLPGVIALSATYAQIHLRTKDDLYNGKAISADFTAHGWREQLGFKDAPLLELKQAGKRLANLAEGCGLGLFEYWLSDLAGHQRDMETACRLLEEWDEVLGSLVEHLDNDGLILMTSDHGNLEDLSTRHHTRNHVPLLIIGSIENRQKFTDMMNQHRGSRAQFDLTDIAPTILSLSISPK